MLRSSIRSLVAAFVLLPCLAFAGPIDINTATAQQLSEALTGVGPSKAAAIVAYREEHGPFRSVADLAKVKGVGESLLEKNQGMILIGQDDAKPAQ
jgi:competence protein ComEA